MARTVVAPIIRIQKLKYMINSNILEIQIIGKGNPVCKKANVFSVLADKYLFAIKVSWKEETKYQFQPKFDIYLVIIHHDFFSVHCIYYQIANCFDYPN